jgi:hypothetical protein
MCSDLLTAWWIGGCGALISNVSGTSDDEVPEVCLAGLEGCMETIPGG